MFTGKHQDVLVFGCGAAGMTLALHLVQSGKRVTILAKGTVSDSSTWQAQGGIATAGDGPSDLQSHIDDTLVAGAGLCRADRVAKLITAGPEALQWLIAMGVVFDTESNTSKLHLTQEGGHSRRRIVHAADATGKAIFNALNKHIQSEIHNNSNFRVLSHHIAIDLVTSKKFDPKTPNPVCKGAYVLDCKTGKIEFMSASCVVLATGGASKAYLHTSNHWGATGDGIAIAWRAGCRVADMEFTQFHPTSLYLPSGRTFLITEAIRGEGGKLLRKDGTLFMHNYHSKADLAPRDIVARAIDNEMKRSGDQHVFLDISHRPVEFIQQHFPTITRMCREINIDISKEPIPVVPAAHYTCGGIVVDMNGKTDVHGLYAIGEVSCTGVHGANRMASNSLLECIVCAKGAARCISQEHKEVGKPCQVAPWDESQIQDSDEDIVISHNWHELRQFMWDYVGIVRSNKRLLRAAHRIALLKREINEFYANYRVSSNLIELRNLATVADLIIRSARMRTESRGLHYNIDYPYISESPKHTILQPDSNLIKDYDDIL